MRGRLSITDDCVFLSNFYCLKNDPIFRDLPFSYFIHINQPENTVFFAIGSLPSQNQGVLHFSGWNMVVFPSIESKNRLAASSKFVFESYTRTIILFNAASQYWHGFEGEDESRVGIGNWNQYVTDYIWEVLS